MTISFPLVTLITKHYKSFVDFFSPSRKHQSTAAFRIPSTSTTNTWNTNKMVQPPAASINDPATLIQDPSPSTNSASTPSSGLLHQHRCKNKDKAKRHDLLCDRVNAWLAPQSSSGQGQDVKMTCSLLKKYLQVIKDIVHMEGYHYKRNLLIPTLIYADKYVQRCGQLGDMR